jgi:uncharacterized membrane protein
MSELLRAYLVTTLCGWSVFPLLRLILARLPDRGYAVSRSVGIVVSAWLAWMVAGALGRPLTQTVSLGAILAVGGACSAIAAWWLRPGALTPASTDRGGANPRSTPWRSMLWVEVLFVSGLIVFTWIEGRNPAVDPDSERFMDYAILRADLRSPGLPLTDPWFAGADLSYYHFGYAVAAFLVRCAGADVARFFTAAVAVQHALLWVGAFGIGLALSGRARGGMGAAFLVLGAGNFEWMRQWALNGLGARLDWFASSRVITDAISEFPWFSLLWGDLHPYVIALPIVAAALAFPLAESLPASGLFEGSRKACPGLARAACFAFLCGVLIATHPWDLPIVAVVAPVLLLVGEGRHRLSRAALWAVGPAISWLAFLPFLHGLGAAHRTIARVQRVSDPREWLMAFGPFVLLGALSAILLVPSHGRPGRHEPEDGVRTRLALALAGAGVLCALVPEMVYLRDLFEVTPLRRMNTVFKLHRLAWLLMGLAAAWLVEVLSRGTGRRRAAGWTGLGLTLAAALVYPLGGTAAWLRGRSADIQGLEDAESRAALSPGADAEALFRALHPGDASAAAFIARVAAPGEAIVEETGEPYTWSSRIGTFSGVSTVLGWGNHEAVWRQGWAPVLRRRDDIASIYGAQGPDEACPLLRSYGARFLVVGERERLRYGPGAGRFAAAARPEFAGAGTQVYDVRAICGPLPQGGAVPP